MEDQRALGSLDVRGGRAGQDRGVADALDEIRYVIDRLERTCRAGSITPGELAEERALLHAQAAALKARRA